ncbi:unnamed protein product [Protopolystoma xenopodis]|uniref:CID domain-containing protein n=1 Tax=Protopolystoma xenopodis TaxID=117903 RepID=A0A448WH00_9PLAT|nr:unnamed protein product [Protopolystoma xenopodis]
MGFEMKLGWGKAVPIPVQPVYIPPPLLEVMKPPPPSGLPFNAQPREWLKSVRDSLKERAKMISKSTDSDRDKDEAPPPAPDRTPFDIYQMPKEEFNLVLRNAIVKVVIPSDRFLFDYQAADHIYYRWKIWSILHGESVNKWSTEEFRMYEFGPLWRPPLTGFYTTGMPEEMVEPDDYPYAPGFVPPPSSRPVEEEDEEREPSRSDRRRRREEDASRRCRLTEAQRGRLNQMIRQLTPERQSVGDLMVWCLEHADSAADITDCLIDSLLNAKFCPVSTHLDVIEKNIEKDSKTDGEKKSDGIKSDEEEEDESYKGPEVITIPKIIARLYLASDILYNSCAKSVYLFIFLDTNIRDLELKKWMRLFMRYC